MKYISEIKAQLVDIPNRIIYPAKITIQDTKIHSIEKITEAPEIYVLPGFIDAHIHIESSMLSPAAFSAAATPFGTVATVSDPHEIANVCGVVGVHYMIENAASAALKIHFGAPSCVPATSFETAGAIIGPEEIEQLMADPNIFYLAEMMNFPGVIYENPDIAKKITAAKKHNKPVDGHAPGLRGEPLAKYVKAGISTDHECTSIEEAIEKLALGMKILIREGSAAKNFDALVPLFQSHPGQLMFCSDDKHPDELIKGHINQLVAKTVSLGYDVFDVLHAACIAPIQHYNLPVGSLNIGDAADFIVVDNLKDFNVAATYIDGRCVAENGKSNELVFPAPAINNFNKQAIDASDLKLTLNSPDAKVAVRVIEAIDGQLITKETIENIDVLHNEIPANTKHDILKIVVVNRYREAVPSIGFIKNFNLKSGALASTVAHDSHNIVAVGVDDQSLAAAINAIIMHKGGISLAYDNDTMVMPLPIAGLMTDQDVSTAAEQYTMLDQKAKALGCTLKAPFMTLSFMALPVIPSLKITDKGLFNVDSFNFTTLFPS
jgi:adenine deaminase